MTDELAQKCYRVWLDGLDIYMKYIECELCNIPRHYLQLFLIVFPCSPQPYHNMPYILGCQAQHLKWKLCCNHFKSMGVSLFMLHYSLSGLKTKAGLSWPFTHCANLTGEVQYYYRSTQLDLHGCRLLEKTFDLSKQICVKHRIAVNI